MRRLRNHLIGIDQGQVMVFSDFEDDGPMWAGEGPRVAEQHVRFSETFRSPPSVHLGMSLIDLDHQANPRMDMNAEDVSESGFRVVFRTWGDTRLARLRASWLAIGDLAHSDDWLDD